MTQVTNAERLVSGKHGGQVSVLTDQGQLMVSSGAFAKHEQLIEQKSQAVFEALEAMNLDELAHAALTDIVGRRAAS